MIEVQVLLLAGGKGKRFWPLSCAKPLVNFLGQPLIKHIVKDLFNLGIKDFKLVTSPQEEQKIKNYLVDFKIDYFVQEKPLGMADAILKAAKSFSQKPLIIINGDDLIDPKQLQKFLTFCVEKKAEIVLSGKQQDNYFPGGYFQLEHGLIKGIVEKPNPGSQPSKYINLILHWFKNPRELVEVLQKTKSSNDDVYEQGLDLLAKSKKIELFNYQGYWQPLKYPWHVLAMMELFLTKRLDKNIAVDVNIAKTATIEGEVIIESGVKVLAGACIKGPVYIGKNTIIGNNALLRSSMVGANCVVGYNSEIARSWVGSNCWFHSNYIGDSVIDENVSFGSGTVTANLRLDEKEIKPGFVKLGIIVGKNSRIGINASLMPGILIGQNCFVGPSLVLSQNLQNNSSCFLKQPLSISSNSSQVQADRQNFREKI